MGQSYRDLVAWQKAMDFVVAVYHASRTLPRDEGYGLSSQMRRAAVAVPSNIADGQSRFSANEFFYFLGRARAALVEVETQLMIAGKLSLIPPQTIDELLGDSAVLGKILNGLISSIRPAA